MNCSCYFNFYIFFYCLFYIIQYLELFTTNVCYKIKKNVPFFVIIINTLNFSIIYTEQIIHFKNMKIAKQKLSINILFNSSFKKKQLLFKNFYQIFYV